MSIFIQVGVSWEDAKLKLEDSKEYYDLPRDDRKRLFLSHMSELSRRLDSKKESMRHLEQESSSTEPSKSSGVTVDSSLKVAKEDAIKEESERHSDRSSSSSSDEEIEKKSKHTKKDKKDKKVIVIYLAVIYICIIFIISSKILSFFHLFSAQKRG